MDKFKDFLIKALVIGLYFFLTSKKVPKQVRETTSASATLIFALVGLLMLVGVFYAIKVADIKMLLMFLGVSILMFLGVKNQWKKTDDIINDRDGIQECSQEDVKDVKFYELDLKNNLSEKDDINADKK